MKLKNQDGCLRLIAYLLIFVIFSVTLYACLEILGLIDVPEEYTVSNLLSRFRKQIEIYEEDDDTQYNTTRINKIRIDVENKVENVISNIQMPIVEGYHSQNVDTTQYNINTPTGFSYYEQLDDYGKIIYNELDKNLDKMKSGTYNIQFGTTFDDLLHEENGEEVLNKSFQLAINALTFDKPNLFYIDISKIYLLTKIKTKLWITKYEVEIGTKEGQNYLNSSFKNEDDVNNAISQIENEKNIIESKLYGSIENQIKIVHDYLIDNLDYDSTISEPNIYNIYGALVNKKTVCEGYARSFKYIMDDLNIPCMIVCGIGVNSANETENHAWNYVRLDRNWYAIDVTWDDPIIIGNGYISSLYYYKYYLKGSREFFVNHTEDGKIAGDSNFKYPTLSEINYF